MLEIRMKTMAVKKELINDSDEKNDNSYYYYYDYLKLLL
jgi:hypothetical protein